MHFPLIDRVSNDSKVPPYDATVPAEEAGIAEALTVEPKNRRLKTANRPRERGLYIWWGCTVMKSVESGSSRERLLVTVNIKKWIMSSSYIDLLKGRR